MKKIPMLVESDNGHDTFHVPENRLQGEVEKQLNNDRWVTLEKKDGSSEILTKKDIPEKEDWKNTFGKDKPSNTPVTIMPKKPVTPTKTFAKKFEKVKSATSTMKAKGG